MSILNQLVMIGADQQLTFRVAMGKLHVLRRYADGSTKNVAVDLCELAHVDAESRMAEAIAQTRIEREHDDCC